MWVRGGMVSKTLIFIYFPEKSCIQETDFLCLREKYTRICVEEEVKKAKYSKTKQTNKPSSHNMISASKHSVSHVLLELCSPLTPSGSASIPTHSILLLSEVHL